MDNERDDPRRTVRRDPRPLAANYSCVTCGFFIEHDVENKMGICGWVPPPTIQEGTNPRRPSVPEDYMCSAWEKKQ